jgi:hypothetical protein
LWRSEPCQRNHRSSIGKHDKLLTMQVKQAVSGIVGM